MRLSRYTATDASTSGGRSAPAHARPTVPEPPVEAKPLDGLTERPTPTRPSAGASVAVAVMTLVAAACQVPPALRYWPVSARVTCTATELPLGASVTRTHWPERYADDGLATEPRTLATPLVTCT